MEKYVKLFSDDSDYWSWSKKHKSMNTKELPLDVEEIRDVKASEKKDRGIMDDSAINDEANSEKIVTLEENLEVIPSRELHVENTNDKMSSTSNEEVNEKFEVGLGEGDDNVVLQTKDSGNKKEKEMLNVNERFDSISQHDKLIDNCKILQNKFGCKCKVLNNESAHTSESSLYSPQDPFIFNINPEDFPVNLSESSSEDESDSTKENAKKFPTVSATRQQARSKSQSENVGTKSV